MESAPATPEPRAPGSSGPAPASRTTAIRRALREALVGTPRDFTEGSIAGAVVLLAIPMILEMGMESLFAVVDIAFVARLGPDAVAAVGITESLISIVYALAVGLSIATAATVARRVGEKNAALASLAAAQGMYLAIAAALAVGAAGAFFAPQLLELMGATEAAAAEGAGYTRVMLGGNVTVFLIFVLNAIFRAAGDAAIAMRVLWIANLLNIALDPCFIFGLGPFPELGVTGAAVATNIGRGAGVALQLVLLFRGRRRIALRRADLRPDRAVLRSIARLSAGGILQNLMTTTSWIGFVRILTPFGSAAVAGFTVGMRVTLFAILPSWGISNATATLVGQCLGAGKPDRAERSVWLSGALNMAFMVTVSVVYLLAAGPIIRLFGITDDALPAGIDTMRIVSYGYVFFAWGMVLTQAYNGAGDTRTPTAVYFVCCWVFGVPLAHVLARESGAGYRGVPWAIAAAYSAVSVAAFILFRRGSWKRARV